MQQDRAFIFFHRRGVQKIAEASYGIPRMINILCDTALIYGFSAGADHIDEQIDQ